MSEISEFDKNNIQQILRGHGDWFSAKLIRLIANCDKTNLEKIRSQFPDHVEAYENWYYGR